MPITVFPDRIEFTSYTLRIDDKGLRVTTPTSQTITGTFSAAKINFDSPMQGTNVGFRIGGNNPGSANFNTIQRISLVTDQNSYTNFATLTEGRRELAGQNSQEHSYASGGVKSTPTPGTLNTIDRFSFASFQAGSDVGDLTVARYTCVGQSSGEKGYTSGGIGSNTIDSFPFASNANASDVGDLTRTSSYSNAHSSATFGYTSGGYAPPNSAQNTIDRFPFATNANATDVGDLTRLVQYSWGNSSLVSGYSAGGQTGTNPGINATIDKFPFASNTNATNVGSLTVSKAFHSGFQSFTHGYTTSGDGNPVATQSFLNIIDKFPFATDANATDVGDLPNGVEYATGTQD